MGKIIRPGVMVVVGGLAGYSGAKWVLNQRFELLKKLCGW